MSEQLVEQARDRRRRRLSQRETLTSVGFSVAFLVIAVPLAATATAPPSWSTFVALTVAYALVSRVEFEVGPGLAVPTQLVFLPMLALLPVQLVPLAVAVAYVLGESVHGRSSPARTLALVGTPWYAFGPVVVLLLAGSPGPQPSHWPVYALAFVAQAGFDTTHAVLRERLALGIAPRLSLTALGEVYVIDSLLTPVGLLAALAAHGRPLASLAVLPIVLLLRVFSNERRERIDQALELSAAYRGTALLLSDVVDADDAYTGLHSRGVVDLTLAVADALGVDARGRQHIEFAALLHDVGKIKVPKEIINKPGKLTPEEWEIVRRHPADGAEMLNRVGGVLAESGDIVRAHHERWDGTGYPDRLRGQAIPLGARIVSVCDTYSALTTDRSYRPATSPAAALAELRACAGTQFDPSVVEALAAVLAHEVPEPVLARAA